MAELQAGVRFEKSVTVTNENTAKKMGSGDLAVFATPAMIALMEATASESVIGALAEDGKTSVGTLLNIKHLAATPVGCEVRCESELCEVDGRRLVFSVKAYDNAGLIGEGTHERFIVDPVKFMARTAEKAK